MTNVRYLRSSAGLWSMALLGGTFIAIILAFVSHDDSQLLAAWAQVFATIGVGLAAVYVPLQWQRRAVHEQKLLRTTKSRRDIGWHLRDLENISTFLDNMTQMASAERSFEMLDEKEKDLYGAFERLGEYEYWSDMGDMGGTIANDLRWAIRGLISASTRLKSQNNERAKYSLKQATEYLNRAKNSLEFFVTLQ